MRDTEAGEFVRSRLHVTRDDIARAKHSLTEGVGGRTDDLADRWLAGQEYSAPKTVILDSEDCEVVLAKVARSHSLRLAFYQAVWELVSVAELIPAEAPVRWDASLEGRAHSTLGAVPLKGIGCSYPYSVERPPSAPPRSNDPDIFLQGIDCSTLHSGIVEAIDQSLACFRRGLYMPATVMLAAAAEATWTVCGDAVAKKLANSKLEGVVNDSQVSISKKVTEVRKALEQPDGKALVKAAGQHIAKVTDAEVWTTALRDRRNALHWGKAKSFVADHSETAELLMGAPLHLGALEAIRAAC